ncbi:acyl carrier protein [Phytohabitans houttuyneae]|uniref:Carrier domain-containing protein n=1 Tax=Phytohabitans houttuyneae TaxID=1076126 RepID=A0A6V8KHF1_9ACTN|nr:acyl carrier protein [Phytohabitans houttuyneae]GFJ81426.1 hypothetical protein Phou_056060 [Phytohabitans houttuyneae]
MTISQRLREMSSLERRDALEELVLAYLRNVLSMTDDEDFAVDRSYFDMGMTSLTLTDARDYLQSLLDVTIDATVLFNEPTVGHLVNYLTDALSEVPADEETIHAA